MNNKSNEIWKNESHFDNWELRKHRFVDEMRPIFFQYLGVAPDSSVLDGGCGTGVFTRYLAQGLKNGRITGFDISGKLVDFGNARVADEGLSGVCELVAADGFELPFEENTFDVVTNYTYLGVLSDPVEGLKEMSRVCREGGTVSAVFPVKSVTWKGEYPFDFGDRLNELLEREEEIYQKHIHNTSTMYYQSEEWHSLRYPRLFDACGLKDIHIYPVAAGFSYGDSRWPLEYRMWQIETGMNDEIRWITERSRIKEYENYGFASKDFEELIGLMKKKQEYLMKNIKTDRSFEWNAALNIIVAGTK